MLSPNREDYLFNLLLRICLSSAQFSFTISMGKYSRYLSICFSPHDMNKECDCSCIRVCVSVCWRVHMCSCRWHVSVPCRTNRKAAEYETTKGLAEKKSSTLYSQSSLLAIYNVLHYITIPLALGHLHTAVTS